MKVHQKYKYIPTEQEFLYKRFFSHTEVKKLYRLFDWLDKLHSLNKSGLYNRDQVKEAFGGKITKTNRRDLQDWQGWGLIVRGTNGKEKINSLQGRLKSLYKLFINYKKQFTEIREKGKNPALTFADLYKARIMHSAMMLQIRKEAEKKVKDTLNKKKLPKIVRGNLHPIGASVGVNFSLDTMARLLGRSKTTAHKAVKRMHKAGIITRKRNFRVLGPANKIRELIALSTVNGLGCRLRVVRGKVIERLCNSYRFNWAVKP